MDKVINTFDDAALKLLIRRAGGGYWQAQSKADPSKG